ncbi:amidohydrolase family protein [soil metagenome]
MQLKTQPMTARFLFLAVLLMLPAAYAQRPGHGAPGTYALVDCRIETITNGTIESGSIIVRDGRIEAVGPGVSAPSDARVIPCDGHTVYPGFIEGGTKIGLMEIGALGETTDFREIGAVTPHMQAISAINPTSIHIPIARVNGVTTVLSTPNGGVIPGTAALIQLHGYTPQQMDLGFRGVIVDFPSAARRGRFDQRSEDDRQKQAKEQRDELNRIMDQAVLFARIEASRGQQQMPEYVPQMEALLPVIRGQAPLLIEVNGAQDILDAIAWVEERNVRAVLMGVIEGWRVADRIAAAGIPVVAGPVHAIPLRESERYDRPYANAGLLYAAGVQVALRTTSLGMSDTHNTRNLPFHAGFAAAYGEANGYGRQQALESVTIEAARIFGVDAELGSIEVGKRATFFFADGDPFETATQLTRLFIDGYDVPLVSKQTQLYDEYIIRTPGLSK